jgi:hypothetical protein
MRGAKARRHAGTKGRAVGGGFCLAAILFICASVSADSLSLPLKGYFHPGRAMPVRWEISSRLAGGDIDLSATNAITSRVQWTGSARGIFPWLVIDRSAGDIRCRLPDGSGNFPVLHPLEDSDFLVASTLEDDSAAAPLLAGRHPIVVHVSGIEGPAMAWETADAILLTPKGLAKIPQSTRANLLAAGAEIAVLSESRPDAALPWEHRGPWWIASAGLSPLPTLDDGAYAPTDGWNPGRSEEFRRRVFLLGAVYCLIVAGAALWRWRWMPAVIIAVSLVAVIVFAAENRRYSPIFRRGGIVRLTDGSAVEDEWVFQESHRRAFFRMPIEGCAGPVFFDASQARAANLMMECDDNGRPTAISGPLPADVALALVERKAAGEGSGELLVNPVTTPLRRLASDPMYRGFTVAGQVGTETDDIWPTLVLKRVGPTQP